ncbi:hypothetical protein SDC9_82666 [bioreactor metagenome]|uniref:Uncharacterized protein n=1 Tax=bioreactor metagenome TaxID=1076179 RepID=A0A644Z7U5_9ZZZZ
MAAACGDDAAVDGDRSAPAAGVPGAHGKTAADACALAAACKDRSAVNDNGTAGFAVSAPAAVAADGGPVAACDAQAAAAVLNGQGCTGGDMDRSYIVCAVH